ncbi:MAG: hypothetical protein M3295_07795 [Chloroflexota bacterium]|nr:hypothetical protein [Chloroflexota bacterium]
MAGTSDTKIDDGTTLAVGSGEGPPLEVLPLTGTAGARAILVREDERPRLLVSAERVAGSERIVISPLDGSHEIRPDPDALAAWIAQAPITARGVARVPAWANVIGFALVIGVTALTLLGAVTFIGWLAGAGGAGR